MSAMNQVIRAMLCIAVAAALAACASDRRQLLQQEQELFERHAGEELSRVNYSHIRGWRPAGDESILIEFNGQRFYLLDVGPPCQRDLRFTQALRLRTTTPRALTTFDQVGSELGWCRIERIRGFDFLAYRAERRGEDAGFRDNVELERDPVPAPLPSS